MQGARQCTINVEPLRKRSCRQFRRDKQSGPRAISVRLETSRPFFRTPFHDPRMPALQKLVQFFDAARNARHLALVRNQLPCTQDIVSVFRAACRYSSLKYDVLGFIHREHSPFNKIREVGFEKWKRGTVGRTGESSDRRGPRQLREEALK